MEGAMRTVSRKRGVEGESMHMHKKHETTESENNVGITCGGRIRSRFHGEYIITGGWRAELQGGRDAVTTSAARPQRSAPTHSDSSHNNKLR